MKLFTYSGLALATLLFAVNAKSQQSHDLSIGGTVTSAGIAVVGATVRLLEIDRATYTDASGRFVFPDVPAGEYTVFVRCIGYSTASKVVHVAQNSPDVLLSLKQSPVQADEVVVSASPYASTENELYQSAQSKPMIELHQSPGSSFAEMISDLPGVAVRYNGSAPARPMIRGLSDNEVLVLENGMRTEDVSTYDPAHSVPIEPMSIDRVDVVRGPASIMYGPNAIGGLINVITNTIPTASTSPFSGNLAISGNTVSDGYDGYFGGVYSNGGNALGVSFGGVHSQNIRIPQSDYSDGVQTFDLDRMPQTFDHTEEAGAGYSYEGDFGMVGVGYKHYQMRYGIPGTPPNPDWIDDPPTTSLIYQNVNSVEMRSLLAINGDVLSQARVSAEYVDYNHSEFPTQQDSTGISNPQANHFNNRGVNVMLQLQHQRVGSFQGTIGAWSDFENLTIGGDQPLGPASYTTDLAGFIYEEYVLSDQTRFQGAVRFDYNRIHAVPDAASTDPVFNIIDVTRTHDAVTASLGAIQDLSSDISMSVSIERSFRPPTVQELFANGADAASNTYSIGDANLIPEAATGIDASIRGRFSGMWFEVSPYVNFINNYIYGFLRGDTLEDLPVRQFSATDARLMGFEASVTVVPIQNIAVLVSSDFVNSEDTRNNMPLPFTPPLRGLLSVTYQDAVYSAMVQWRLAASQNRLGVGDTYTAGYGIVNIGFGVRLTQDRLVHDISVHCDNLFDQVYRDNLSVIKDFVPQPARGFRLNYDLVF